MSHTGFSPGESASSSAQQTTSGSFIVQAPPFKVQKGFHEEAPVGMAIVAAPATSSKEHNPFDFSETAFTATAAGAARASGSRNKPLVPLAGSRYWGAPCYGATTRETAGSVSVGYAVSKVTPAIPYTHIQCCFF